MSRFIAIVSCVLHIAAFAAAAAVQLNKKFSGNIPFPYEGETYNTWVQVFPTANPMARPLLVLHGGPGLTHDYLLTISDLARSRPVIFYDQIGAGRSTHLDDKPQSFWTVDLFLSELNNVIAHFGIGGNFDLLGHSWGGMLASELAVLDPPGLRHLVLSDSLPQQSLWGESEAELLASFPQSVQQGVTVGFSNPTVYRAALTAFFDVHGCTLSPWPKILNTSFDYLFDDPNVQIKMGTTTANWTIIDRLHSITVPTLVLNGAADIAQDFVVQPFLDNIQGSIHYKFSNSSHTPMLEQRALYMSVVGNFLGAATLVG